MLSNVALLFSDYSMKLHAVVIYLHWLAPQYIKIRERHCILNTISFLFVTPKTNFVQGCISFSQRLSSCGASCAASV